ncbi:SRPBCC family protein [Georgenia alba]|uniref:SRPBCC family protein n=1 Tax=Georgenia alba TaxID=2233858 RepID=A0ABW2Q467_9MICO
MNAKSAQGAGKEAGGHLLADLKESATNYAKALGGHAVGRLTDKVSDVSDRLTAYAEGGGGAAGSAASEGAEKLAQGDSPVKAGVAAAVTGLKEKVKGAVGGGGEDRSRFKFNNIVESIDVGAPVDVVYDAWTAYQSWPDFMKKVEHADLDEDAGEVTLGGQVLWSHRQWKTTITDQVPDRRIVWESSGQKGHISGVVTFHPLADDLTRLVLVAEYRPQGFVEKTGNIWRAANRRIRLELKFFVRHVMRDVVLHPEDTEGFRAEIEDGETVRTHEEVLEDEQAAGEEPVDADEEPEDSDDHDRNR